MVVGWIIVGLATLAAGWMAFDGWRALIVGDYVTPSSGPYAGQLGPWQHVVRAVGIAPRSTRMKALFAGYGMAWLAVTGCYVAGVPWAPWAMIGAAAGALWYLPVGTGISLLILLLQFAAWPPSLT